MTDPAASMPVHRLPFAIGVGPKIGADPVAWQRVLQQAEQARWFLGASPVSPSGSTLPSGRVGGSAWLHAAGSVEPSADVRAVTALPARAGDRPAAPAHPTETALRAFALPPWGDRGASCGAPPLTVAAHPASQSTASDPASASPVRGRAPPQRAPQPPLRMHVEPTPDGVMVWMGIDGSADVVALRAAALLEEIRRHSAHAGIRVAAVFCNGSLAYAASAHEEKR